MNAAILNTGNSAWVFEEHAERLAKALQLPVVTTPTAFNYLLGWDGYQAPCGQSFIPFKAIQLASDKRWMAEAFEKHGVATPKTYLLGTKEEVEHSLKSEPDQQLVLKWPTGCGATGHRMLSNTASIPEDWPKPYVVQQFIRLKRPEVYRLYAIAGETFGWNARRFPEGGKISPFVAHAQGAHYELETELPSEAEEQAQLALKATGLLDSFGCADLMKDENGRWLVLEVNTDGIFNHVDRDIDVGNIAAEIDARLARAFHAWCREHDQ